MKPGAPKGNKNASTGAATRQCLELALYHNADRTMVVKSSHQALYDVFCTLIEKARDGDLPAISQLLDRSIGKPRQEVYVSAELREVTELSDQELTSLIEDDIAEQ